MKIRFVLVGEGPTDARLVPLLETYCLQRGAREAAGIAPDLRRLPKKVGKGVNSQVKAAVELEPTANLVFVHRDADGRSATDRLREISEGVPTAGPPVVGVVPIQETEAWLLLDEQAIRDVAGRPSGKSKLGIPKPSKIENTANPKELLQEALVSASELKGRRLQKFRSEFAAQRARLFDRVDPDGPIRQLSAWVDLGGRIDAAFERLNVLEDHR